MKEVEEETLFLREYWHVIKKRRWTIFSVLILLVFIVTFGSFIIRPTYKATAVIQVERENPKVLSFEEIYSIDASQQTFYQTQVKLIKSRSVARKVIDRLSLLQNPEFSPTDNPNFRSRLKKIFKFGDTSKTNSEIDPCSPIIDTFLNRLVVEPDRNSQIINVSFISCNPKLSADAANATAECFVKSRLEAKYLTAKQAYEFLNNQIKQILNDIASKEQGMQKYALDKEILSLDDSENIIVMQLVELNTEYTRVKAKRIEKEAAYRGVMNVSADSIPEVIKNPLIQQLKAEYASLEREYAEKSRKFKAEYPAMIQLNSKLDQANQRLDKEINDIISKVRNAARAEYQTALEQEQSIKEMLDQQRDKTANLHKDAITYNNLKTEVDNKRALLQALTKRQNEAGVSAEMKELGSTYIQIIDKAEVPRSIYRPNRKLNILLSVLVGLMLGIGLVFFFEYLDNSIKSRDDVEKYIKLPTLGIIHALDGMRRSANYSYAYEEYLGSGHKILPSSIERIVHTHPKSSFSETYRALRTSVLLSSPSSPPKVILVTSSLPKEGKTATAVNLAIVLAQLGKKVILIESDLRRPKIEKIFRIRHQKIGFTNFLTGDIDVKQVMQETKIPNLYIIPGGPIPPNPAELLASSRMEQLLNACKETFSFTILDSPPLLAVTDAQILASKVDGVIMVVHGGLTPRDAVKVAKEKLQSAKIIGVVLNQIDSTEPDYYYKHYYHHYGRGSKHGGKGLVVRVGSKK